MERPAFLEELISAPLTDFQSFQPFSSGIESMDRFIRGDFSMSVFLIKQIADLARRQTLAGCQFLTVEALATSEYSAVGFYERCGFAPNEVKKPYKDMLRMYMTLYSKDEVFDE